MISRVNELMEWCAGMVVAPKANGKVRICVDLTHLNQNVCRERHILPSVEQLLIAWLCKTDAVLLALVMSLCTRLVHKVSDMFQISFLQFTTCFDNDRFLCPTLLASVFGLML